MEGGIEREIEKGRRNSRERCKKGEEKAHGALRGLPIWLFFHVCGTPQLADIILPALPGGVSGEVSTVTRQGPLNPLFLAVLEPSPTILLQSPQKRSPSPKSPLHHVSHRWGAPGIPLSSFPWSLGRSLCHVAQSEPSLGRITQLSMGGQMTIIRLHSSGPYLKRQEWSPRT